jgi:hypothetical protein
MRKIAFIATLLFSAAAHADAARVDQLGWLTGCWGFETENGRYEEIWTAPTGNNMLGMSRRIEDGFTREFEFLRIVTSGGGGFDFVAMPQGNAGTSFNSLGADGTRIVFENPEHDFPSRITYELTPPDSLKARIEGVSDGRPMGINFPMKRKPCP